MHACSEFAYVYMFICKYVCKYGMERNKTKNMDRPPFTVIFFLFSNFFLGWGMGGQGKFTSPGPARIQVRCSYPAPLSPPSLSFPNRKRKKKREEKGRCFHLGRPGEGDVVHGPALLVGQAQLADGADGVVEGLGLFGVEVGVLAGPAEDQGEGDGGLVGAVVVVELLADPAGREAGRPEPRRGGRRRRLAFRPDAGPAQLRDRLLEGGPVRLLRRPRQREEGEFRHRARPWRVRRVGLAVHVDQVPVGAGGVEDRRRLVEELLVRRGLHPRAVGGDVIPV